MPDYFYGPQAEQFVFYRIPKALFTDPGLSQYFHRRQSPLRFAAGPDESVRPERLAG